MVAGCAGFGGRHALELYCLIVADTVDRMPRADARLRSGTVGKAVVRRLAWWQGGLPGLALVGCRGTVLVVTADLG